MFSTSQPSEMPVDMRARIDKVSFVLIFGSLGPLAFFAPKGMWIPILLLLLFRLKTLASLGPRGYRRILARQAIYLILPVYGVLSAVWAVVPANAVITGAKLFGYLTAAMAVVIIMNRLSDADRRSVLIWTAAGLIVADLFVWMDLGSGGALSNVFRQSPFSANQYSRGAAISAFVVLPLAVGLFRVLGSRMALLLSGICVATIFALENEAAKLAVLFGIVVFLAVRWRGVLFWPVILLPLVIGLMSPLLFAKGFSNSLLCTLFNSKPSAAHRLIVYEFSSRNIFKKPVLGWGMDASRSIPGGQEMAKIYDCKYMGKTFATLKMGDFVPLHPHNASLQLWLELGAVGVGIFTVWLGVLILRWQRGVSAGVGRPLIAGLFAVIFLIYNISFGLWQGWLIFALIMLCAIIQALHLGGAEKISAPST